MINKHGGSAPGLRRSVEEIQEGIRNGVRKVNIDTDNRLAFTAAVQRQPWPTPPTSIPATSTSRLGST